MTLTGKSGKFFILILAAFIPVLNGHAQLKIIPVFPGRQTPDNGFHKTRKAESDTINLPFWDDFSGNSSIPDPARWIEGSHVYINQSLAINPPTLGVATLDGAKNNAGIYDPDPLKTGLADSLVSKPINLGTLNTGEVNTIFLSFFWQYFGNAEIPDQEDSLRLLFKNQQNEWEVIDAFTRDRVVESDKFSQVIYKLDPRFMHGAFQFKFEVFARLSGPYDAWHIDYVYLDKNRSLTDTHYFDRAIFSTPGFLFGEYSAMPINQFFEDPQKFIQPSSFGIFNLDNIFQPIEYTATLVNTFDPAQTIEILNFNTEVNPILQGEERRQLFTSLPDINSLNPELDSIYITLKVHISSGDSILENGINYRVNDSTSADFVLHNHYARDDGSAEFGIGLEQRGGKVAYMFVVEESDVLNRVDIHFPNIGRIQAGSGFSVFVWKKLSDNPLDVMYERENLAVEAISDFDQFQTIRLPEITVVDTFYIGWEQYTPEFMTVGLDKQHDTGDKIFYNVDGAWAQNTEFSGSLMLRPYFGQSDPTTGLEDGSQDAARLNIYPNPSSGFIRMDTPFENYKIFDLSGALIREGRKKGEGHIYDLTGLREGLYMLRLEGLEITQTCKIIIRK
ncbi:MAG: T9SS type A sorting domain-containing protein [Cyclobacteriaceae bacterium]|nr:T9SS type A sorting domain-containing protein [Cyclobacteriaceae bacterium]